MNKVLLIGLVTLPLAACGAGGPVDEQTRDAFVAEFVENCIAEAGKSGASEDVTRPICQCSAEKVVDEIGVVSQVPPEVANKVLNQCIEIHPIDN